ncbi:GAF domain-containing protein [Achromobacter spanius]|uniref:GAF domain-containing protein n=1 Tax=Achromobacter spanius TaxID=217203 RepID=UPI0037FDAB79
MIEEIMTNGEWLNALEALEYAANQGDGTAMLAAIDSLAYASLQHMLFTVNRFDEDAVRVDRVYSSNPEAYPLGGSKEKRGTKFGQHVLLNKQVFIGEGQQAIRDMFDDHEVIRSLGVSSIVNAPVVLSGRCLGTVNVSLREGKVPSAKAGVVRLAAVLAAPALALIESGKHREAALSPQQPRS